MAIFRPPKGTFEQLSGIAITEGEIVFNTTDKKFYTGDNTTLGGIPIVKDEQDSIFSSMSGEFALKSEITGFISSELDPKFAEVSGSLATAVEVKNNKNLIDDLTAKINFIQQKLDRMGETERAATQSFSFSNDPVVLTNTISNENQDVVIEGETTAISNIKAKSVEMKNMNITIPSGTSYSAAGNNAILINASEDVEIKKSIIETDKEESSNMIKITNAESIVIRDCEFNGRTYNTLMTGQNTNTFFKYMLIENCSFNSICEHVAIWCAGWQDGAVLTISNCTFGSLQNVLDIGCFSAVDNPKNKLTVNFINCTITEYEHSNSNDGFTGFILCTDDNVYSGMGKGSFEFFIEKPFSNVTINIINTKVNDEILTQDNFEMGTFTDDQKLYVYSSLSNLKNIKYIEHPEVFPKVNVK